MSKLVKNILEDRINTLKLAVKKDAEQIEEHQSEISRLNSFIESDLKYIKELDMFIKQLESSNETK